MKEKTKQMNTIAALLCGIALAPMGLAAAAQVPEATMINLQAAFQGESNAHAKYLVFAAKADSEGYAGVASLFRAAARAEQIHASNHAAAIKGLGGASQAKLEDVVAGSTRQNLETALKGEVYERDEMYPAFIEQAQAGGNAAVIRTFTFARAAEVEHARLYGEALQKMETMKASATFYVCPVCGFTTNNSELARCSTCATPRERFERVT